jgi:hypothetical protein
MADANPVHRDPSPIRKGPGQRIIKVRCDVCNAKYGYDEDKGDTGCPDCEMRLAARKIKDDKLKRLEEQAALLEKENAEFEAKEKALQDRIKKATKKK